MNIQMICIVAIIAPLLGALMALFFRKSIGKIGAHSVTIAGVAISFILSVILAVIVFRNPLETFNVNLYTWASGGSLFPFSFHIGLLMDPLTAIMMVTVTFVSLLVHLYSIGYMAEDAGYARFFSYISLFTFMMLMLVSANNFLQLFFGWEGVGLVSYLLIGFWYDKESANQASLKAFLVNRVGDFGFILGLGLILSYVGSLDYDIVFRSPAWLSGETITLFEGHAWPVLTVICLLLFVGAMAKSAQIPLHVWLPESMEGPTPISALIHAATMVTAGVFMIARMSPIFEYAPEALQVVLVVGATGALFTGVLALVMNDIKRVIAYSTLSQLGYMMVAMGASAYSAGIFHLVTHACFKALLFLAAGSVIIGLHHEQDMRKMGGLWRKMPITWVTFLIGTLALCAVPPFSGYFSKDTIIEAAHLMPGSLGLYAYYCVMLGAFVTTLYSFRALFMTFHGRPKMDKATWEHVKESPVVVWLPLLILAVPSIVIGYILFMPMLYSVPSLLGNAITVLPSHHVLLELAEENPSAWEALCHAPTSLTVWLTVLGVLFAWVVWLRFPRLPRFFAERFAWVYQILLNKYGFDAFNQIVFVNGVKRVGRLFSEIGDRWLIDGACVNGTAALVRWMSRQGRKTQTGFLYHYIAVMILSLFGLLYWLLFRIV